MSRQTGSEYYKSMNEKLDYYRRKGYKEVEGWIYPATIKCICELSDVQKSHGIKGSVCEIGIHHGRFFILLHLLTDRDEYSIACDLFERQNENIGSSGKGNKEIFLENLRKTGCDLSRIEIITRNSLNISPDELLMHGGIRMISVDGGHEAGTAYNDIKLAADTLADGGIIWLDDFPHESWLGVMEGTYRYLFDAEKELWPIAVLERKLLLTNNEKMSRIYMNKIFETLSPTYDIGISLMVGKRVLVMWKNSPRKKLKKYLQRTRLWKRVQKYRLADQFGKILNKHF